MDSFRYEKISDINPEHGISIVREKETGRNFICKELSVYNRSVYEYLKLMNPSHIPTIYELSEDDNKLTVIEDIIQGETLQSIMYRNNVFTREIILDYAIKLCEILHSIHTLDKPVIHRDVKPSNVIITPNGELYLIDLNACKFYDPASFHKADTTLLGTPGFAAPEQYGFGESTPKTDIYGAGILIRKMINQISLDSYSNDIAAIANKCSEIDPDDRYDSILEVKKSLTKLTKINANSFWHSYLRTPIGKFTLPGYRTGNPFHMVIATPIYALMIFLTARLQVENGSLALLISTRIFFGLFMLSTVLCTFNYLGIHEYFPLCNKKNLALKITGVILLNFTVYTFLLIAMIIIAQFL